jgi:DMSO/TMAO reductase YedYZ molybdopterin-dependent catalytic subunit
LLWTASAQAVESDPEACPGGFAPAFRLNGKVANRSTYDFHTLSAFSPTRQQVTYFAGGQGLVTTTYIGVPLADLLTQAVVQVDPAIKNDILRKYVAVTGSDCYEVIVSLAEVLSDFGGDSQVFVAFATGTGQPLAANEGMARLVVPGDKKGGRYVSNIVKITVRSAP